MPSSPWFQWATHYGQWSLQAWLETSLLHWPLWGACLAMVLGAGFLARGQGFLFRFVTALLGVLIGVAWSKPVIAQLSLPDFAGSEQVYAVLLGLVGFSIPEAVLFLVFAIPAAFASMTYLGLKNPLLGFVPAFLLGGALGLIVQNHVRAFVASALGAWMLVMGVLTTLYRLGWVSPQVLQNAWAIVGAIAFFTLGGTLFQMSFQGKHKWRSQRKAEKLRLKALAEDKAALEQQWAKYSKDRLPKV